MWEIKVTKKTLDTEWHLVASYCIKMYYYYVSSSNSTVNDQGDFTGKDVAFIYQDLELALYGEFKAGIMVRSILCLFVTGVIQYWLF